MSDYAGLLGAVFLRDEDFRKVEAKGVLHDKEDDVRAIRHALIRYGEGERELAHRELAEVITRTSGVMKAVAQDVAKMLPKSSASDSEEVQSAVKVLASLWDRWEGEVNGYGKDLLAKGFTSALFGLHLGLIMVAEGGLSEYAKSVARRLALDLSDRQAINLDKEAFHWLLMILDSSPDNRDLAVRAATVYGIKLDELPNLMPRPKA